MPSGTGTSRSIEWQPSCMRLQPRRKFRPQPATEQETFAPVEKAKQLVGTAPVPPANLPEYTLEVFLAGDPASTGTGKGRAVDSESGEVRADITDDSAHLHHEHEQLAIPAGMILRIETRGSQKRIAPKKGGLLEPA